MTLTPEERAALAAGIADAIVAVLAALPDRDTPAPAPRHAASPWLTRREACAYVRVSDTTLQRAITQGRLKVQRVNGGQKQRFHRADLDAYLRGEARP